MRHEQRRKTRRARLLAVLLLAVGLVVTVVALARMGMATAERHRREEAAREAAWEANLERLRAKWRAEAKAREAKEKAHPSKASKPEYQDPASLGRLTAAAILARSSFGDSTAECWAAYREYTAGTANGPPALDPDDLGGMATFVNACKDALAAAGY